MRTQSFGTAVRRGVVAAGMLVPLFPALALADPITTAPPASQQLLYEWRGRVDKEIRIEMRGGQTNIDWIGNRETDNGRVRVSNALPRSDAYITVETVQGRGRVDIVQQPSRQNGYTAIVRIRDPQSGASNYRIRAYTTATTVERGSGRNRGRWGDRDGDNDDDDRQSNNNNGGWRRGRY